MPKQIHSVSLPYFQAEWIEQKGYSVSKLLQMKIDEMIEEEQKMKCENCEKLKNLRKEINKEKNKFLCYKNQIKYNMGVDLARCKKEISIEKTP